MLHYIYNIYIISISVQCTHNSKKEKTRSNYKKAKHKNDRCVQMWLSDNNWYDYVSEAVQ